jgi:hypothetical protein
MFPDPPGDGRRTVFCRTCTAWRHPRHACARDSSHETAPLSVMRLRRDGPSALSGFDDSESRMGPESRRQHAVGKFDLTTHADGPSSTFGTTEPVYYLTDAHDPAVVIERWIAANEGTLSGRGLTTENVTRALSKAAFEAAWRDLRERREFDALDDPERGARGGGDHGGETECPFCGARVATLPEHLPCDAASDA